MANVNRVISDLQEIEFLSKKSNIGGINRLAYSDSDMNVRKLLLDEAKQFGLFTEFDSLGNIFIWNRSPQDSKPPVIIGSHIDSVPDGGNYDGALGVLCAIEVVRFIAESNISTSVPIVAIGFAAEESVRFNNGCIGSRMMMGELSEESMLEMIDIYGYKFNDVLRSVGLAMQGISSVRRGNNWAKSYIELHIDQGPELRDDNLPLGIITDIAAPLRYKIIFSGETMHSGGASMKIRKDALLGAAEFILEVERLGLEQTKEFLVTTVGKINISPNLANTVPGKAELHVDIRGISSDLIQETWSKVWDFAKSCSVRRGLTVTNQLMWQTNPVSMSTKIINMMEESCILNKIKFKKMVSGSGHDALYMSDHMDTGMLFIRNIGGVSHNPRELCSREDIELALRILTDTALSLANN